MTSRNRIGATVLALTSLAQASSTASTQVGAWMVYGPTRQSCGSWVGASGQSKEVLQWWMLGYVSGAGHEVRLAETDAAGIEAWVTKHCTDHPLDTLVKAAMSLVDELKGRAQSN